jgi:hypothetical protein
MRILIIYIALAFVSCKNETDPILTAKNKSDNRFLGITTLFTMDSENNFCFSFLPVKGSFSKKTIIKGKFYIKRDTIYLTKNNRFKKAILKDGYVEFLDKQLKVKIIQNKTQLNHRTNRVNTDDFSSFTFYQGSSPAFEEGKSSDLTKYEIGKLKVFIQSEIDKAHFKHHSKQSEFYKQYISIRNKENEKIVWINCISRKDEYLNDRWKNEILEVNDGGEYFFQMKINLTKGIVFDFYVNGEA